MAVEILRPIGNGSVIQLTANGASVQWDCVDEVTADDDSTYVNTAVTSFYDLYTIADSSVNAGTINSVTIYFRARHDTFYTRYVNTRIKISGSEYTGASLAMTDTYVNYSEVYTTNPKTGVAWTWSDINALEAGVQLQNKTRVTQVWVEVDYTPSAGSPSTKLVMMI